VFIIFPAIQSVPKPFSVGFKTDNKNIETKTKNNPTKVKYLKLGLNLSKYIANVDIISK
jgi:hypothetical protein